MEVFIISLIESLFVFREARSLLKNAWPLNGIVSDKKREVSSFRI